ncbi:MAG TPA: family 78 glycoside hydrolase catalytic domain [Tepidisphaeraceae bacterium]|nr:family 78 glycoside hydrolase catalytic domain [Tepidisphaeraceae bacterium]
MRTASLIVAGLVGVLTMPMTTRAAGDQGAIKPANLRCEHLVDPVGVDLKNPRLSWIVESGERNQRQSAYQILVASSEADLQQDRGNLWDSGKIQSNQTIDIVYAGKPLTVDQRCFWKVRVWDRDGKPSDWSQPARWTVGLSNDDWSKSLWIGFDKTHQTALEDAPLDGASWIWLGGSRNRAPAGARRFASSFTIPDGSKVKTATLCATARDSYALRINGKEAARTMPPADWKRPTVVDVANFVHEGENELVADVRHGAAGPAGLIAKLVVQLQDGKSVTLVTDQKVRAGQPGADGAEPAKWSAAKVLGTYGEAPWGKLKTDVPVLPPPSYLRSEFDVSKPVRSATLHATALGIFDVHVNGHLYDDRFNPGWTDYAKRVYYRAYDVASSLHPGRNALGAILADGWYSGYIGYARQRDLYGSKTRFRAELRIQYEDGSTAIVGTGPDWKASSGPILEADFLAGETYDAGREQSGWDAPGFDDAKWEKVDVGGAEVTPLISWHPGPPASYAGDFHAKQITEPTPGVYVLDMGQNAAGIAHLKIQGEPGQRITLRFAERLNPDGTIYTTNLRSARATDTYICRGGGVEEWEPRFTFHGFQYIEVAGLKSAPTADTVYSRALSSQTPVAGAFECSDSMINQLHSNIYWTQRSNFIDIPTDCPQRDERLGWTGDAQVYIRTATLNCDVQAFFAKWLLDLADGQRNDGQFPMVAPVKVAGDDGGPAWADAGVICPWTIYEVYGDKRLLERQYPSMKKFIEFCGNRSTKDLLPPKQYHCFGDWLSIGADTPHDVIYEAYFARCTKLTAQAAEVLGKTDDAAELNLLFDRIKGAFNKAYVSEDGAIKGNTQACYVLAIASGLLDEAHQKQAAEHLVSDIEHHGWHLTTGFVGTKDLMLVLAKIGRNDVAYRLLEQTTFPSWGFSIEHGATTIWERWDGWTPERGFQDPGMNSFAHYSFGAVYQWIVENVAGIRAATPAYDDLIISPQPGGNLTWANTRYLTAHGPVETKWKLDGTHFALDVTIPCNTRATVVLPTSDTASVNEGGKPLTANREVTALPAYNGRTAFSVGSGQYMFTSAFQR